MVVPEVVVFMVREPLEIPPPAVSVAE